MSAFVFKIQANMDPNHRDRIAFVRLCSGKLTRGMKVKQVRSGKSMSLNAPQFFFAQDRALAEEAYAGDVVGIPNHGTLRIGDTLTEGEELNFVGVPNFAPEILRRVRLRRRHEGEEAEAGAAAIGRGRRRAGVPADRRLAGSGRRRRAAAARRAQGAARRRIRACKSIGAPRNFSSRAGSRPPTARRWISSSRGYSSSMAEDFDGDLVFLSRNSFDLDYTGENNPGITFSDVKDIHKGKAAA